MKGAFRLLQLKHTAFIIPDSVFSVKPQSGRMRRRFACFGQFDGFARPAGGIFADFLVVANARIREQDPNPKNLQNTACISYCIFLTIKYRVVWTY